MFITGKHPRGSRKGQGDPANSTHPPQPPQHPAPQPATHTSTQGSPPPPHIHEHTQSACCTRTTNGHNLPHAPAPPMVGPRQGTERGPGRALRERVPRSWPQACPPRALPWQPGRCRPPRPAAASAPGPATWPRARAHTHARATRVVPCNGFRIVCAGVGGKTGDAHATTLDTPPPHTHGQRSCLSTPATARKEGRRKAHRPITWEVRAHNHSLVRPAVKRAACTQASRSHPPASTEPPAPAARTAWGSA
jgi:hypothetical protein